MAISFTTKKLPVSGALKQESGLPFSCVVQPFARTNTIPCGEGTSLKAEDVSRCHQCYAYINHCCTFLLPGWTCALCGHLNEYHSVSNQRYARASQRAKCPELRAGLLEVDCPVDAGVNAASEDGDGWMEVAASPIFVALVDRSGGPDYLELVRTALLAALEAVPPSSLFALLTFADTVELYDLRGRAPAVLSVPLTEEGGGPTACDLASVLPLDAVLTSLVQHKDTLTAAIDGLEPALGTGEGAPAPRGFGGALQAVLRYLGSAVQTVEPLRSGTGDNDGGPVGPSYRSVSTTAAFAGARLMAFLSGPPNFGRGSIMKERTENRPVHDPDSLTFNATFPDISPYSYPSLTPEPAPPPSDDSAQPTSPPERDPGAASFYELAASAATALGVCVDVYAVSEETCGLDVIMPLIRLSGGDVCLYPVPSQAALPQDVYRRLSMPTALAGLLRVRTSHEFRCARAYGHLFPDQEFENLAHVIACDPHAAFVFDFEFASAGGFSLAPDEPPVVQMVFQYSLLVPLEEGEVLGSGTLGEAPSEGTASATPARGTDPVHEGGTANGHVHPAEARRCVLRRRMRILTVAVDVAKTPRALYEAVDPAAVLAVLMHKILKASETEGLEEARALLQDWLVILLASYNRNLQREKGAPFHTPAEMDVLMEGAEGLQTVARGVFALLRSPLLSLRDPVHGDNPSALAHLWSGLPPDELMRAIYPTLSSYSDPDTLVCQRHSLSRAALVSSGAPIFLLDTFTSLVLYYVAGYPRACPSRPRRRRPCGGPSTGCGRRGG
eukprot:jgi/Botrbrau1/12329/Bobra.4_3s0002.2